MNFLNYLILSLITMSKADAPIAWQLGFQDPATPVMEGIIDLHHDIWAFMTMVSIFVSWMLCRTLYHFNKKSNPTPEKIVHGATLEIVWTTLPAIILAFIAFSSFALLYSLDEIVDPAVTIKVVGAQWYWHYEYSDYIYPGNEIGVTPISFDSYMIADDDLEKGHLRLLEVDNRVVVPVHTHLRFILTAADVIHSWAIPSLGIKTDCVPGRLNQTSAFIKREGIYYGQCSEICGVNHAFMPIVVEAVGLDDYINWVAQKIEESA